MAEGFGGEFSSVTVTDLDEPGKTAKEILAEKAGIDLPDKYKGNKKMENEDGTKTDTVITDDDISSSPTVDNKNTYDTNLDKDNNSEDISSMSKKDLENFAENHSEEELESLIGDLENQLKNADSDTIDKLEQEVSDDQLEQEVSETTSKEASTEEPVPSFGKSVNNADAISEDESTNDVSNDTSNKNQALLKGMEILNSLKNDDTTDETASKQISKSTSKQTSETVDQVTSQEVTSTETAAIKRPYKVTFEMANGYRTMTRFQYLDVQRSDGGTVLLSAVNSYPERMDSKAYPPAMDSEADESWKQFSVHIEHDDKDGAEEFESVSRLPGPITIDEISIEICYFIISENGV